MHRVLMSAAAVGAVVSAVFAVASVFWPTWIEGVFDVAPDAGDGSAEWGVTAVALVATVVFAAAALWEHRRYVSRTRPASSPGGGLTPLRTANAATTSRRRFSPDGRDGASR